MYLLCIDNIEQSKTLTISKCYKVIEQNVIIGNQTFVEIIADDNYLSYFKPFRFKYFLTFSEAVNVADKQGLKIQCCTWKTNQMYVIVHIRPGGAKDLDLCVKHSHGEYKEFYIPTINDILSSWIIVD